MAKKISPRDPVEDCILPLAEVLDGFFRWPFNGGLKDDEAIRKSLWADSTCPSHRLAGYLTCWTQLSTDTHYVPGSAGPREWLRRRLQTEGFADDAREMEGRFRTILDRMREWEGRARVSGPEPGYSGIWSRQTIEALGEIQDLAMDTKDFLEQLGATLKLKLAAAKPAEANGLTGAPKAPPSDRPSLNETDEKIVAALAAKSPQTGCQIAIAVSRSEERVRRIFSEKLMPFFGYFNVRGQGYFPPKNGPGAST